MPILKKMREIVEELEQNMEEDERQKDEKLVKELDEKEYELCRDYYIPC